MCDDIYESTLSELLAGIPPFIIYGKTAPSILVHIRTSRGSLSSLTNKKGEWVIDLAHLEGGWKGLRKIKVNGKKVKLIKNVGCMEV